mmetsp:Transcript_399/g.1376  ORF Transcript_399/g.1376 Transcript_399/m.1376 type:complete len:323 (+) Transcript_399:300-1268(+)|eukprot:scaffold14053_cov102-Isochrysis_galbana.AAC.3
MAVRIVEMTHCFALLSFLPRDGEHRMVHNIARKRTAWRLACLSSSPSDLVLLGPYLQLAFIDNALVLPAGSACLDANNSAARCDRLIAPHDGRRRGRAPDLHELCANQVPRTEHLPLATLVQVSDRGERLELQAVVQRRAVLAAERREGGYVGAREGQRRRAEADGPADDVQGARRTPPIQHSQGLRELADVSRGAGRTSRGWRAATERVLALALRVCAEQLQFGSRRDGHDDASGVALPDGRFMERCAGHIHLVERHSHWPSRGHVHRNQPMELDVGGVVERRATDVGRGRAPARARKVLVVADAAVLAARGRDCRLPRAA